MRSDGTQPVGTAYQGLATTKGPVMAIDQGSNPGVEAGHQQYVLVWVLVMLLLYTVVGLLFVLS